MKTTEIVFASVIAAFMVPFIIRMFVRDVKIKEDFETFFEITFKGFRVFSIVLMIVTIVLTILMNILIDLPIFANILLIICILIFSLLVVVCRFKIVVCDNIIVYTPCFSKRKHFRIEEISFIKVKNQKYGIVAYYVFVGDEKVFQLSNMLKNVDEFVSLAKHNNVEFKYANE